ncbi:protein MATERNALLY EXPRESSED GENE 1-like [Zea mays]|eukprot:XP_023156391.1 protein MATERNALLY EXPRESSED GENE 1-like [Zea mays]
MENKKRVDALVFFSLLLLGYFAAHAHGKGHVTNDIGVSTLAKEGIMRGKGAQCAQGFLPCKDNKCYCCIGGRTHGCYSTLAECSHACF